jgi:uncharacterized protein (TIGR03435 family)
MRLMMQSLLADRFKVITHTEKQTKPVFRAQRTGIVTWTAHQPVAR